LVHSLSGPKVQKVKCNAPMGEIFMFDISPAPKLSNVHFDIVILSSRNWHKLLLELF
jgi:hypothetical protein